jgi:uncharacterized protein YidB (DUF937 family)
MTALLAVLAVAGYQHRDKLTELLGTASRGRRDVPQGEGGRAGGTSAAATGGGLLGGGLGELLDSFRSVGDGDTADSWVRHGPNRELTPDQLERAVGPDTMEVLARQTGLPREEILSRLTRDLPGAVDRYTPEGRLPEG